MKSLLILILILTSGYLGVKLMEAKGQLITANSDLEELRTQLEQAKTLPQQTVAAAAPAQKSWLQQKIQERNAPLEGGAYNRQVGVSRAASVYFVPGNGTTPTGSTTTTTAMPTPGAQQRFIRANP